MTVVGIKYPPGAGGRRVGDRKIIRHRRVVGAGDMHDKGRGAGGVLYVRGLQGERISITADIQRVDRGRIRRILVVAVKVDRQRPVSVDDRSVHRISGQIDRRIFQP